MGAAVDSVPTALFCFLKAGKEWGGTGKQFEETLKLAIRMGGDTDTIANMACALAGAWLGDVPEHLTEGCEGVAQVRGLGKELYEVVMKEEKKMGKKEESEGKEPPVKKQKI